MIAPFDRQPPNDMIRIRFALLKTCNQYNARKPADKKALAACCFVPVAVRIVRHDFWSRIGDLLLFNRANPFESLKFNIVDFGSVGILPA